MKKNVLENTDDKNKPEMTTKGTAIIKHSIQQFKRKSPREQTSYNLCLCTSSSNNISLSECLPSHTPELGPWEKCSILRELDSILTSAESMTSLRYTKYSQNECKVQDQGNI